MRRFSFARILLASFPIVMALAGCGGSDSSTSTETGAGGSDAGGGAATTKDAGVSKATADASSGAGGSATSTTNPAPGSGGQAAAAAGSNVPNPDSGSVGAGGNAPSPGAGGQSTGAARDGGQPGRTSSDAAADSASATCSATQGTTCSVAGAAVCKACRSSGAGWRECTCQANDAGELTVGCVTHNEASEELGCSAVTTTGFDGGMGDSSRFGGRDGSTRETSTSDANNLDSSTGCAAAEGQSCTTAGAAVCEVCRSNGAGWRACTCTAGDSGALVVSCVTHNEANPALGCSARDGG